MHNWFESFCVLTLKTYSKWFLRCYATGLTWEFCAGFWHLDPPNTHKNWETTTFCKTLFVELTVAVNIACRWIGHNPFLWCTCLQSCPVVLHLWKAPEHYNMLLSVTIPKLKLGVDFPLHLYPRACTVQSLCCLFYYSCVQYIPTISLSACWPSKENSRPTIGRMYNAFLLFNLPSWWQSSMAISSWVMLLISV